MPRSKKDIRSAFIEIFGADPLVVRAPGRVNIIGEHTDYNDGFVLPAAIDLSAYLLIQRSEDNTIKLISADLDESFTFQAEDELVPVRQSWVNYFLGVLDQFKQSGYTFEGFNLIFTSDIPIGAGLSSSAALECGFGRALAQLFGHDIEPVTLAQMGQQAEHKFAGVQCGIMDQFASCMGKKGHVIKLDCRNLAFQYFPADFKDYELVLFDSRVKHNLADSQYNIRRQQCEEGLTILKAGNPDINSFRDVSQADLENSEKAMTDVVFRRCKYVVEENQRVEQACRALAEGDILKVGELMSQTHVGLRDEYEVSCAELDSLITIASRCKGYVGGRMMGGGFGGCTINLIHRTSVEEVIQQVETEYEASTGISTQVYRIATSDGVNVYKEEVEDEI